MRTPTTHAGGCLLILAIFAGIGTGIAAGQPMLGTLIGTGVGIVLAVAVWLIDRRHR